MVSTVSKQTMDLLSKLNLQQGLQKAAGITTATGLVWYDLEAQAKLLYPVLTPFRNSIARVGKRGPGQGLAAHWKVITGINSAKVNATVSEGKRGGQIDVVEADKIATYKGIGLENFVNFEADYASEGFDDVKALAVRSTLEALMIQEEQLILHGNTSLALGTTPTPTVVASITGGSLSNVAHFVFCVALGYDSMYGSNPATVVGGVVTTVARSNADASSDTLNNGVAIVSAQATATVASGSTGSLTCTVTAVKGAYGYAWFCGTTTGAVNCAIVAVTTTNRVVITSLAGVGTQKANYTGSGTDFSLNSLAFDGLITQALASTGYYSSLDGQTLTSDSQGGIVEIDTALKFFWDTYRISPTAIIVGSQQIKDITKKILSGTTNPVYRINVQQGVSGLGNMQGGNLVTSYLNKFALGGAVEIPIVLHPNMPDGTIMFDLDKVPYPTANIAQARAIRCRRDYFQVDWPVVTRQYTYGVYSDQMLQVYVPFGMGVLTNIAAG